MDIGDVAFPIEDGTLSFANGLNLFRVKGHYSQYDLLFNEQIPEEEIDKYDKDDSEIYYARKPWFSNKKVAYGNGWCKLKEKREIDIIFKAPLHLSIAHITLEQREALWEDLIKRGAVCI